MANFTAHGNWDLSKWDLSALSSAALQSHSPAAFSLLAGDGTESAFGGANFGKFGSTGMPHQGTIAHIAVNGAGGSFSIGGLDLGVKAMNGFIAHDSVARLERTIFSGKDHFDLSDGGHNTVAGYDGKDTFDFGGAFDAKDQVDGGAGFDTVKLDGDYSSGVALLPDTLSHVEALTLAGGHSYDLTLANDNIPHHHPFTINASGLGTGDTLTLDDSAERGARLTILSGDGKDSIITGDGKDVIYAGGGNDTVIAGRQNDVVYGDAGRDTLRGGIGDDTVYGGAGNDRMFPGDGADTLYGGDGDDDFFFHARLGTDDRVDGGDGTDTIHLIGADTTNTTDFTFSPTMITNVESVELGRGTSYRVNFADNPLTDRVTINASALGAANTLTSDASNVTGAPVTTIGGAGNDVIQNSNLGDTVVGGLGADTITAGDGADVFQYTSALDSTGDTVDTIIGFNPLQDTLDVANGVTGVDSTLTGGLLNNLDGLTGMLGVSNLDAGHAVLVQPLLGTLAGSNLLVVDQNGIVGYQPGQDLVINLDNATNLTGLDAGSFI